jgi:Fusaric acid resistance protein family
MGTLLGGLVGYLLLIAFPDDNWFGSVPILALWTIPCSFVQASSYGYLGALATFTPIIIVFGKTSTATETALSPERYALDRMEEIIIGVAIALAISTVLWPVSSIRLLRSEMMISLEAFQTATEKTMGIYERMVQRHDDRLRRLMRGEKREGAEVQEQKVEEGRSEEVAVTREEQIAGILEDIQEEDARRHTPHPHHVTVEAAVASQPFSPTAPCCPFHRILSVVPFVSAEESCVIISQRSDVAVAPVSTAAGGHQRTRALLHDIPYRCVSDDH